MDYKKYADVVYDDDDIIIATVWTGANYYIDTFDKSELISEIRYLKAEFNISRTIEELIAKTHVSEMQHLCRHEDFSDELVQDWIAKNRTGEDNG